jgi:hypothetical protein
VPRALRWSPPSWRLRALVAGCCAGTPDCPTVCLRRHGRHAPRSSSPSCPLASPWLLALLCPGSEQEQRADHVAVGWAMQPTRDTRRACGAASNSLRSCGRGPRLVSRLHAQTSSTRERLHVGIVDDCAPVLVTWCACMPWRAATCTHCDGVTMW